MNATTQVTNNYGKASLAETLFQKLFGKRYFLADPGISREIPGFPGNPEKSQEIRDFLGFPGKSGNVPDFS